MDLKNRVEQILKYHDQERRALEDQIIQERYQCELDLDAITFATPTQSDIGVRVQSSPTGDARMVNLVDRRLKRRQRAEEIIEIAERQILQIDEVQRAVYQLGAKSKCALMALYYPYRSYEAAAEFLGVDKKTLYRRREAALMILVKKVERLDCFK